jgi:VIT1/CCC1 family predicted Fe2+/Mn2+ transporter
MSQPAPVAATPVSVGRASSMRPTRVGPPPAMVDRATDAEILARRVAQVTKGAARAAVLGVSDGLVTNVCLILAMAGADASAPSVRLAGFASLLAGALSMAAGEWVSVRSQVELYGGLLGELQTLIRRDPELILDEVARRLEEAGFARETAQLASTELPLDEPRFLRFTSNTVFGIDPAELGSPMTAALTSLALFSAGAFVPLAPWLVTQGGAATLLSVAFTVVASVAVGAVVNRWSGRPAVAGALRQLLIVAASAAATYTIGNTFGAVVG